MPASPAAENALELCLHTRDPEVLATLLPHAVAAWRDEAQKTFQVGVALSVAEGLARRSPRCAAMVAATSHDVRVWEIALRHEAQAHLCEDRYEKMITHEEFPLPVIAAEIATFAPGGDWSACSGVPRARMLEDTARARVHALALEMVPASIWSCPLGERLLATHPWLTRERALALLGTSPGDGRASHAQRELAGRTELAAILQRSDDGAHVPLAGAITALVAGACGKNTWEYDANGATRALSALLGSTTTPQIRDHQLAGEDGQVGTATIQAIASWEHAGRHLERISGLSSAACAWVWNQRERALAHACAEAGLRLDQVSSPETTDEALPTEVERRRRELTRMRTHSARSLSEQEHLPREVADLLPASCTRALALSLEGCASSAWELAWRLQEDAAELTCAQLRELALAAEAHTGQNAG